MHYINDILTHSPLPLLTALLLGLMTMISPCPFCSDITAIAFLSKKISKRRAILWNGVWYVLGKCFSYLVLALVFIFGAQVDGIRHFFEHYGEPALGPFLVIVGLLIGWIGYREARHNHADEAGHTHHEHAPHRLIRRLSASENPLLGGGLGAFLLGVIFALAFCPYSGLLYFGTLIPLTLLQPVSWSWLMPICFGIGDALPVLIIALVISYNLRTLGHINGNLQKMELWLRRICVIIFVGFGLYLSVSIFTGHHHHDHEHVSLQEVHSTR